MYYLKTVLLVFISFFILVSCSSSNEIVPEYSTEQSEISFNGMELKFSILPRDEYAYEMYTFYPQDTLFADLAKQRVHEVEEKYDVKINFTFEKIHENLLFSILSDEVICDIFTSNDYELYDHIKSNLLYPIDSLESGIVYTDSDKWGRREQLVSYVYKDHLYGVLPMYWPETMYKNCDHFFFVNESMIASIGETDPREYVENGEWTRDKYLEVLEAYTHIADNGNKVYALVTEPGHYFSIALLASGIYYINDNEDGTYSNAFYAPGAVDKITWIHDTFWQNYGDTITNTGNTQQTIDMFVDEGAAMVLTAMHWGLNTIQYAVDNFGLLPFPLSDDLHGTGWVSQSEVFYNTISFPANIKEPEVASIIVDALFEHLEGYETEEALFDYYNNNVFHDPRDTEVVFEAVKNCYYVPYRDDGYMIPNAMSQSAGSKTVMQILESNESKLQKLIDNVIIPDEESCDLLWGDN